jgi:hypothetical protein
VALLTAANLAELMATTSESWSVAPHNKLTELKPNGFERRSSCSQMGLARVDGRDADTRKKAKKQKPNGAGLS